MTTEMRLIILRETKRMSFALVAKRHGLTRHQVAGVVFRHKNPLDTRICSVGGFSRNKNGKPRRGPGIIPAFTELNTRC